MTNEQAKLRAVIGRIGMGVKEALNALQEAGIISDLVVELEDVADGDVGAAVTFLVRK